MIHEWRSYVLKPGKAGDYLALLAHQGLPLVTRHLPMTGYWLAETGTLNTIHHLWSYADWAERDACRASLSQEQAWTQGFIPAAFALVESQQNRLLRMTRSSARVDAVLAARRRSHAALPPGAPLFAAECAALVIGAAPGDAEAVFQPLSGDPAAPLALLSRRSDPVPPDPAPADPGACHSILRPLMFSPL